ncbi:MAG TPA: matrixin family metalloprotease [Pyrinomonadaceae bacterium]|nr:matrixin family metalloprotease [Pyrinomonadaceae bacterium]
MLKNRFRLLVSLALLAGLAFSLTPKASGVVQQGEGDPAVLAKMHEINTQLRANGLSIAVEEVHLISIGQGRAANRIHQTGLRWVAGDPRRLADGDNITYLVDQSDGATASGLTSAQTEAAIDRAMVTWDGSQCMDKVDIIKRADSGADPDIFDSFFGFGGFGNPFLADITNAGWLPKAFFDAVGGPGGGNGILAFSVSFIFIDGAGNPTDINGDNFLDTALNEVYYNDNFGNPGGTRPNNPWGINIALPGIDVETVGLHENGHSLGLGHFGPPPDAVMNPVYAGIRQTPLAIDTAGMCSVWGSWPQ